MDERRERKRERERERDGERESEGPLLYVVCVCVEHCVYHLCIMHEISSTEGDREIAGDIERSRYLDSDTGPQVAELSKKGQGLNELRQAAQKLQLSTAAVNVEVTRVSPDLLHDVPCMLQISRE